MTAKAPVPSASARPTADDAAHADDQPSLASPGRRSRREPAPFGPVKFRALVKTKTAALKKGNYEAAIDEQGMLIKKNRKETIDLPLGTPIAHKGKNLIDVEIDGEWSTIAVMRFRTYNQRFSQALVDFMNGNLKRLDIADYEIPWPMFILVLVPWGIPIITLGGALPIVLGAAVSGANFAIISRENWSPSMRVVI
ncbi:MAG: hypothetical protein NZO58_05630, partial [Gemmataceae bacterium]|nr:hypothetical protein [Gemmataceae bacterium]